MPDDPGGLIIPDLDMRVTIGKNSHFSDLYIGCGNSASQTEMMTAQTHDRLT